MLIKHDPLAIPETHWLLQRADCQWFVRAYTLAITDEEVARVLERTGMLPADLYRVMQVVLRFAGVRAPQ